MFLSFLTDYAQYDVDPTAVAALSAFAGIYSIFCIAIGIFMLVCEWRIFSKAGEPGWAAIVPFYNAYVLAKIAMGNGWLFLLLFVPFVNFVVAIIMIFKLSSAFGHGVGFGFGLLFLSIIFFPILAFGSSEYVGA
ncbi:MAG: DUF5684 domain-containing protein [Lachnospiraceae bacterium]|nr:DUF5684 domain-containing protein [Lachnospiraceae bacterium]